MRIDEHTQFTSLRQVAMDRWHSDGPYWIERLVGDLGHGHALVATNGNLVYPLGEVVLSIGPMKS